VLQYVALDITVMLRVCKMLRIIRKRVLAPYVELQYVAADMTVALRVCKVLRAHTHTHRYMDIDMYIYVYIYMCIYIIRKKVFAPLKMM